MKYHIAIVFLILVGCGGGGVPGDVQTSEKLPDPVPPPAPIVRQDTAKDEPIYLLAKPNVGGQISGLPEGASASVTDGVQTLTLRNGSFLFATYHKATPQVSATPSPGTGYACSVGLAVGSGKGDSPASKDMTDAYRIVCAKVKVSTAAVSVAKSPAPVGQR